MWNSLPNVSFEFFPARNQAGEHQLWQTIWALSPLAPDFLSVTYGAGGSDRAGTDGTLRRITEETPMAAAGHLTCVGQSREIVDGIARDWWQAGIRRIVALRGDARAEGEAYAPHPQGYENAADLVAGLRRIAASGATIAGIDGGPWLMAEAGLLDGHPATNHWEDLENFASRFPEVDVRNDRFTVAEGRLTSGGATPAIEMMLHIIGARHGAGFAARVAGLFLYDGPAAAPRPQSRLGGRKHNALTAKANALMEAALDEPLPLSAIAETLGTSPRSLQQQFRLRLNTTPQDHYLQLRLAEARRLVTDTDMPLMEVAIATGFTSQSSFARAFRTAHGTSARDLRQEQARPTAH